MINRYKDKYIIDKNNIKVKYWRDFNICTTPFMCVINENYSFNICFSVLFFNIDINIVK